MKIIKWLAKWSAKIAIAFEAISLIPIGIAYHARPDAPPPPWAWGLVGVMATLSAVYVVASWIAARRA